MVYDVTDFANNLILLGEIDKIESNLIVEDNKLKIKSDDKEYDVISDNKELNKCIHLTFLESLTNLCLLKISGDENYDILLNDIIKSYSNVKGKTENNEELSLILDDIHDKITDFIHISYYKKKNICSCILDPFYRWFNDTCKVFSEINGHWLVDLYQDYSDSICEKYSDDDSDDDSSDDENTDDENTDKKNQ